MAAGNLLTIAGSNPFQTASAFIKFCCCWDAVRQSSFLVQDSYKETNNKSKQPPSARIILRDTKQGLVVSLGSRAVPLAP